MASSSSASVPAGASGAVLQKSEPVPEDAVSVEGPNFEQDLSLAQFLESYERIGFQANSLGKAIRVVNKMVCATRLCSSKFLSLILLIEEVETV